MVAFATSNMKQPLHPKKMEKDWKDHSGKIEINFKQQGPTCTFKRSSYFSIFWYEIQDKVTNEYTP